MLDQDTLNTLLLYAVTACGGVTAALWLGMVIWTWRDMRQRSRDPLAQIAAALVVAVLNVFGLLIYVMLRPSETLTEAYERSLEEERCSRTSMQSPTARLRPTVRDNWQVCPYCHTKPEAVHPVRNMLEHLEHPPSVRHAAVAYEAAPERTGFTRSAGHDSAAPVDAAVEYIEQDQY